MHRRIVGLLTVVGALVFASSALADRISYSVPAGSGYTVTAEGGGNGITKVVYNSCLTAGQPTSFPLTVVSDGSGTGTPTILKDQGAGTLSVSPPTVTFTPNQPQTVTVTIVPQNDGSGNGPDFRLKYNGTPGLGEGPGLMVKVACVLNPAPMSGTPNVPSSPATTPAAPPAPTRGAFGVLGSSQSAGPARCIAVPRGFRVRQGQTSVLTVTVANGGVPLSGALVRVTIPGRGAVIRRTASNGVLSLRVTPRRTGTVVVQSEACFGAARFRVLAARVVATHRVSPAFTG